MKILWKNACAGLWLACSPPVLALSLGAATVHSGRDEPLRLEVPVSLDSAGALRTSAWINGDADAVPLTTRYDAADHLLRIDSTLPARGRELAVTVLARQGSLVFRGTYDVPLHDAAAIDDSRPDHVYAGQIVTASADDALQPPTGQRWGPVSDDDSLEHIARSLAPRFDASPGRVALALFTRNSEQFVHGDPRQLRRGAWLRVPDVVDVALARPEDAQRLMKYLHHDGDAPHWTVAVPIVATETPRWERSLTTSLAALVDAWQALSLQTHLVLALVALCLPGTLVLRRRLVAGIGRWRRWQLRRAMADADSGYETLLGAARPVSNREALAIARLQDLLVEQPARDDIRVRLAERLSRLHARDEFLHHARVLRGHFDDRQFDRIRRLARVAGIADPVFDCR